LLKEGFAKNVATTMKNSYKNLVEKCGKKSPVGRPSYR
jgi:hypothetical protein